MAKRYYVNCVQIFIYSITEIIFVQKTKNQNTNIGTRYRINIAIIRQLIVIIVSGIGMLGHIVQVVQIFLC